MSVILRTSGLSKRFGRTLGLDRLTFDVSEGSVYGLIGPNGAGKTTAIKTLMNIIDPTSGRAEVLGADSRRRLPAPPATALRKDWLRVGKPGDARMDGGGASARLPQAVLSDVG